RFSERDRFPLLKQISTISMPSCPDSYFHCFTALWAASIRRGCPPSVFTFFTWPFAVMRSSNLTEPDIFIFLASSGYCGLTLTLTFLTASSACDRRDSPTTQAARAKKRKGFEKKGLDTAVSLEMNSAIRSARSLPPEEDCDLGNRVSVKLLIPWGQGRISPWLPSHSASFEVSHTAEFC